jgi:hypothetical protein
MMLWKPSNRERNISFSNANRYVSSSRRWIYTFSFSRNCYKSCTNRPNSLYRDLVLDICRGELGLRGLRGDGNRVGETVGTTTTKYLVDTLNPTGYSQVLDELVNGAVTKTYTYGLQRISENQLSGSTWTPTFYGYDGHGNVRFTTSTAGAVGNTYQFDAFGAPIRQHGNDREYLPV